MSLWGDVDPKTVFGSVSVTTGLAVEGLNTRFTQLEVEDTIEINGMGSSYITSITDDTNMTIAHTPELTYPTPSGGYYITGAAYAVGERPLYVLQDPSIDETSVYGVSPESEAGTFLNRAPHAGWVEWSTYNDQYGNVRSKTEVLVASGSINEETTASGTHFGGSGSHPTTHPSIPMPANTAPLPGTALYNSLRGVYMADSQTDQLRHLGYNVTTTSGGSVVLAANTSHNIDSVTYNTGANAFYFASRKPSGNYDVLKANLTASGTIAAAHVAATDVLYDTTFTNLNIVSHNNTMYYVYGEATGPTRVASLSLTSLNLTSATGTHSYSITNARGATFYNNKLYILDGARHGRLLGAIHRVNPGRSITTVHLLNSLINPPSGLTVDLADNKFVYAVPSSSPATSSIYKLTRGAPDVLGTAIGSAGKVSFATFS